jgi:hypothetical protein
MSIIEILAIIIILIIISVSGYYIYDWYFGNSQLKCIINDINGETYCIRERSKLKEKEAVNLLAKVVEKGQKLVDYLIKKYPDQEFAKRLKEKYNKSKISETLPTSTLTAYTENKEKISLCLNKQKENNNDLIDENLLVFVLLHEICHQGYDNFGHTHDYWLEFKKLLTEAELCGIYKNVDYKANNQSYCGIMINDNPYFSLKNDT